MLTSTMRRAVGGGCAALVSICLLAAGCNTSDIESPAPEDRASTETSERALGESSRPYLFDGPGAGPMPTYQERVTLHLANRLRRAPQTYNVESPRGQPPYTPRPPVMYDEGMSEAARWNARHYLTKECRSAEEPNCPQQYNREENNGAFNSCCTIGVKNGRARCVSNKVQCTSKQATTEEERWRMLVRGRALVLGETGFAQKIPGEVAGTNPMLSGEVVANAAKQLFMNENANALGIGQFRKKLPPEGCQPCSKGTCVDPSTGKETCGEQNENCRGLCKGPECNGKCMTVDEETGDKKPLECTLPTSKCKPKNFPARYYANIVRGTSNAPIPTLLDGIHMKIGYAGESNPFGYEPPEGGPKGSVFGKTPPKKTEFAIHYYEPAGPAQNANLVVDGACKTLQQSSSTSGSGGSSGALGPLPPKADVGAIAAGDAGARDTASGTPDAAAMSDASDAGGQSTYIGLRYETAQTLQPGCHRYVFAFKDANGFVHTYPSHGSLGARIERVEKGGQVYFMPAPPNSSCPIWSPDRPDTSCLPKGNQCAQGQTRPCYTGRANTRGKGICKNGTESCSNGRWSGVCQNQVLPKSKETCGDGKDNNCNGFVDEGCEDTGGSGGDAGTTADAGSEDAGSMPDTGTSDTGPSRDAGPSDPSEDTSGGTANDAGSAGGGTDDASSARSDATSTPGPINVDAGDATEEDDEPDEGGCGCSGADGRLPGSSAVVFFLLALGALRHRRRERRD